MRTFDFHLDISKCNKEEKSNMRGDMTNKTYFAYVNSKLEKDNKLLIKISLLDERDVGGLHKILTKGG